MTTATKWQFEAEYYQACNCDYGCPCEFQAPPTMGFCEGTGAWRITRGSFGDVSLDGLSLGFAARWPGAIHEGGGTAAIFVDERADEKQREALLSIASGQAGGMPFEVIVQTFAKIMDPLFVSFKYDGTGERSSVSMGDAVSMAFEPIKNPVNGGEERMRIEHETGFLFQGANVLSAKECRGSVGELDFSYPNKSGFVTTVRYGN